MENGNMKREFLTNLELDQEIINKIMAEHGRTINTLNSTHKEELNGLKDELTEKDTKLSSLESDLSNVESLKSQLEESEAKVSTMGEELKTVKIERALVEAGANDIEYAKFKLGEVELDDLDSAVKSLKEKLPNQFQAVEVEPKPANNGKLEPPKDRPRKTKEEILAIKNDEERIKEIAQNKDLFAT